MTADLFLVYTFFIGLEFSGIWNYFCICILAPRKGPTDKNYYSEDSLFLFFFIIIPSSSNFLEQDLVFFISDKQRHVEFNAHK